MIIRQNFSINYRYEILFTRNLFEPANDLFAKVLANGMEKRIIQLVFVIDQGLQIAHPDLIKSIEGYITSRPNLELLAQPLIVKGGEESKNSKTHFEATLKLIDDAKVDRHAYIVAIGGGAVLDMVGFAAAIGHRGIRHIRIPTTVLSQNDSGVGVKNGINHFGKKNFLGTFAPPYAVFNDFGFLTTLDDRDWLAGTSEAVKVGVIKDKDFFAWIEQNAQPLKQREMEPMEKLIFRCAELHSQHISGSSDPFEKGSSRPLDFGHWAAHKLEQLSRYEIKHGEAVAIGIALDVEYAIRAKFLPKNIGDRIISTLNSLGFVLYHELLLTEDGQQINPDLLLGLEEFREHLGGVLTVTMIKDLGDRFDVHEMNPNWIQDAAKSLQKKQGIYAYSSS